MRKDGGFTISDRWHMQMQNYQTGQLDRRTLLHKRYQIQRVIGQGGMGAVYQARDIKRQGAVCAIKEMSLSMVSLEEQPQAIQNFKIEAKILWSLNHPNLPVLKGFFSQNQRYFLVMEYIDGLTLEDYLERNGAPFPERRVLTWARQLCDVLDYLHSQNPPIIFRDMKPGNIMLTRKGQIKLIDFGIARFFRPTEVSDTQLLGTPGFAPPEQYGKTQTDVRSDIYALGITLFQLLTNTLSEKGFGIQDVRAINPQVSTTVARALEKATALEPDNRYKNVEAFRRALFGEDTFIFENGESATTAEDLAELCDQFPEEAADYLAAGEIEVWLHEIGAEKLSHAVTQLRTNVPDPQEAIEQFVRGVLKNSPQYTQSGISNNGHLLEAVVDNTVAQTVSQQASARKRAAPIQVSPRTLDFGLVHSGMSASLLITIHGHQGTHGSVHTSAPWIKINETQFDGPSAYIKVHVSSAHLQNHAHYTGSVIIIPDDDTLPEISVKVEADIEEYVPQEHPARRSKTVVPDMDDEEEEETIPTTGRSRAAQRLAAILKKPPDAAYDDLYAQPTIKDPKAFQWNPWPITSTKYQWQQSGLTFSAAFMLAGLLYNSLAQNVRLVLPPHAAFIGILAWMIPFASIGALLVQWRPALNIKEVLNRLFTGMSSVLLLLALLRMACQVLFQQNLGALQLIIMLAGASLAATIGTDFRASKYIVENTRWALVNIRRLVQAVAIFIGGGLGFCLTLGFAVGLFTLFGILVGIGVGVGLIWSIDYLLKENHP